MKTNYYNHTSLLIATAAVSIWLAQSSAKYSTGGAQRHCDGGDGG